MDVFEKTDLTEIEVSDGPLHVRVARLPKTRGEGRQQSEIFDTTSAGSIATAIANSQLPTQSGLTNELTVKSTVHGIFHVAPAADEPPFVTLGSAVTKGQDLCVVEAMKIFNRVVAPASGIVAAIHVKNGAEVTIGNALFTLDTSRSDLE